MKRLIPNAISISRIVLSFILLLTFDVEWLFVCVVLFIGLSDIADGYIARKYELTSRLGASLDSISDLIFFVIILLIIYLKYTWILMDNYIWFLIIVLLKILSAIISKIKFGEFVFVHTLANKATGFLIFLSIMILPFDVADSLFNVVFFVALIAAGEELLIILVNKKDVDQNQKSIFKS